MTTRILIIGVLAADIRAAREITISSSFSRSIFAFFVTRHRVQLPTQCTPLVDGQGRNLFPFLQAIDDWETNRWAVVSWFFNDRSIVALSIRLFSSSSKRLTPFVCHHQALFPALEKPILSLIDRSNASSETDGSRRNRRDRVELAETAYERRYRHCTIEWNDRSDCFVLSSDSQTGRLSRRVTWTSMATERLGLAGNTSFRLSGIWIFQFFCSL